jgi:MoxR-like ATPase
VAARDEADRFENAAEVAQRFVDGIETVVHGKREKILLVLTALACRGHVLFEDVPGTAKTVLARAIAQTLAGSSFSRVQCTPDLQPTDVTGLSVFDQKKREFEFRPGPIFANVVLVDEINRAMPKTQSALLEAMAEQQVTVDGVTRLLAPPFLLLATENPIEHEGTFPLPEAQLDRFFLRTTLGYPAREQERRIVREQRHGHPLESLEPSVTVEELLMLQQVVEDVYVDELIESWILDLVAATRELPEVALGASVRGSLALERGARALALLHGRDYVTPDEVEALVLPVLGHRIVFATRFLIEQRRGGGDALEAFRELCFRAAPRPDPEAAQVVPLSRPPRWA